MAAAAAAATIAATADVLLVELLLPSSIDPILFAVAVAAADEATERLSMEFEGNNVPAPTGGTGRFGIRQKLLLLLLLPVIAEGGGVTMFKRLLFKCFRLLMLVAWFLVLLLLVIGFMPVLMLWLVE